MDQATHNKIVSFIWGIADDVPRDLFKRGKHPDVILPMCVIRRMDAEIEPIPLDTARHKPEPELDRLSNILKSFNEQFGTLFTDTDRVARRIRDDIAPKVAADTQVYKQFVENESFRRFVGDMVYAITS